MNKSLKTKLDNLWSQTVKIRAGNRCEMCHRSRYLNSHHFFGRRYLALRFDVENGFALCPNCHINTAHQKPSVFVLWAIKTRGEGWHNRLLLKSQKVCKNPDTFLIEAELRKIIQVYS